MYAREVRHVKVRLFCAVYKALSFFSQEHKTKDFIFNGYYFLSLVGLVFVGAKVRKEFERVKKSMVQYLNKISSEKLISMLEEFADIYINAFGTKSLSEEPFERLIINWRVIESIGTYEPIDYNTEILDVENPDFDYMAQSDKIGLICEAIKNHQFFIRQQ